MNKRPIPTAPASGDDPYRFNQAVKENLEILTGRRAPPLQKLDATATLAEVIAKVNEIIDRLQ